MVGQRNCLHTKSLLNLVRIHHCITVKANLVYGSWMQKLEEAKAHSFTGVSAPGCIPLESGSGRSWLRNVMWNFYIGGHEMGIFKSYRFVEREEGFDKLDRLKKKQE